MYLVDNSISLPIPVVVVMFSAIATGVGGLLTTCGHMLINIKNSVASLDKRMAVRDEKTEGRLLKLERDDERNQDERDLIVRAAALAHGGKF